MCMPMFFLFLLPSYCFKIMVLQSVTFVSHVILFSVIVANFISRFNCSEKLALQALKSSDWHLEGAFDFFYSQPQIKSYTDTRHLEELYNRYKGKLLIFPSVYFLSPHFVVCTLSAWLSLGLLKR